VTLYLCAEIYEVKMDMKNNNVEYDWTGDFAEGHGSGKQKVRQGQYFINCDMFCLYAILSLQKIS
jgi:hypothetical protein